MKKLVILILFMFFGSVVYADTYCQWSGTEGTNCIGSDSRGHYRVPGKVKTGNPIRMNEYGYYLLVVTEPSVGADQTKDAVVWGITGNQITKTWTVRDLTTAEIDARDASPMPLSEYYLWKALIATGTITLQQAQTYLPQQLIDAYLARDRLENP